MTLAVAHASTTTFMMVTFTHTHTHTHTHRGTHITLAIAHIHSIWQTHTTTHTQAHTQPRSQYLTHNPAHTQLHSPLLHSREEQALGRFGTGPLPSAQLLSRAQATLPYSLSTITSHFPHSRGQQATASQPPQTHPDRGEKPLGKFSRC